MLMFELKISFLLIYIVYRNDLIWRPGHLFTFGRQRKGAYLKQGGNQGQSAYFFLRTSRICKTKLSIDIYLKRIKKNVVPTSFKEQRSKQTWQTFYSFEGTVHSHRHNS